MINIDNVEKFVTEELAQGEHFSLRKEGWIELITRLRQAEKDAARYRWALDNCLLGIGRNGATWDLQFEGPSPDHIGQVSDAIDEAMQCK